VLCEVGRIVRFHVRYLTKDVAEGVLVVSCYDSFKSYVRGKQAAKRAHVVVAVNKGIAGLVVRLRRDSRILGVRVTKSPSTGFFVVVARDDLFVDAKRRELDTDGIAGYARLVGIDDVRGIDRGCRCGGVGCLEGTNQKRGAEEYSCAHPKQSEFEYITMIHNVPINAKRQSGIIRPTLLNNVVCDDRTRRELLS